MKKILVIEDMRSIREQITSILTAEKYEVKGAANGKEGIKLVKDYSPDLIISDIMMPEMDGYELLNTLKKEEKTKTIPFIFTTVKSQRIDIRQGMASGADDYITKPFSKKELLEAVASRLKKKESLDRHYKNKAKKFTGDRLHHLLSTSPAIIYSYTYPHFNKLTYISENISSLLGYSPDEFMNILNFWPEKVHEEDRDFFCKSLKELEEKNHYKMEYRFLHKDGSYRWIYDEQKLVITHDGEKKEVTGSWLDITERKEIEREQLRLTTAVSQLAEAVIITDTYGNIKYINPAFTDMTGYTREEVCGKSTGILKSGKHSTRFYKIMWNTISQGKVWKGNLINKKEDGSFYHGRAAISPIKDKNENIINYVSVMCDITKEIEMEKELLQARKLEAIGTLAGGIAHDFNNILGVMIGYAEMAHLKEKKGDTIKNCMDQILKAGYKAKDLVMQILTFSNPFGGEKKELKFTNIVKETVNFQRPTLPENIKIITKFKAEKDTVSGDATQVHQILMNLYKNAVQAMKGKGGTLEIILSNIELDSLGIIEYSDLNPGYYLKLSVSDTGTGMTPEITERIFDPFYTTKKKGEGTGLGLSIVHSIIKNMGGTIKVYSEPWLGTTFQIFLPVAERDSVPEKDEQIILKEGNAEILLIDDEEVLLDITRQMLESIGHKVTACTDARKGIELFKEEPHKFDILITDQSMPDLLGTDVAREITEIRENIPVLLCTGFSDLLTPELIKNSGIKKLLLKPVKFANLAKTIDKLIRYAP